ncbi:MAG TPA: hypothetical protein VM240_08505 [Verrucomicrobiae bacterium]|nr:hypothetical protein [Verrucomicrobiae bacterium]
MRNLILASALAAACFAGSTLAASASNPGTKSAAAADGSRVSCFSERVTGSNLRRKVCMTDADRDQRRKEDQASMENLKNGSSSRGKGNSDPGLSR